MTDNFNLSGGSRGASLGRGGVSANQHASPVDNRRYDAGAGVYAAGRAGAGGGDNSDLIQNDVLMGGVGPGGFTQQMRGMNLHGSS